MKNNTSTKTVLDRFKSICSAESEEADSSDTSKLYEAQQELSLAFELTSLDNVSNCKLSGDHAAVQSILEVLMTKKPLSRAGLLEKIKSCKGELEKESIETLLPLSALYFSDMFMELKSIDTELFRSIIMLPANENKSNIKTTAAKLESSDEARDQLLAAQLMYDVFEDTEGALALLNSIKKESVTAYGILLKLEISSQLKLDKMEVLKLWVDSSSADVSVQSVARYLLVQALSQANLDMEAKAELEILRSSGINNVEAESATWNEMWMNTRLGEWNEVSALIGGLSQTCDLEWSQAFQLRQAQILDYKLDRIQESNDLLKNLLNQPDTGFFAFWLAEKQLHALKDWNSLKHVYESSKDTQVLPRDVVLRKLAALHWYGLDDSRSTRECLAQISQKTSLEMCWLIRSSEQDGDATSTLPVLERSMDEGALAFKQMTTFAYVLTRLKNNECMKLLDFAQNHREHFEQNNYLKLAIGLSLGNVDRVEESIVALDEAKNGFKSKKAKGMILLCAGDCLESNHPAKALTYYELSQEFHKDEGTRKKLVRLYDLNGNVEASIEERKKLLESEEDIGERCELLVQLGALEEKKGGNQSAFRYLKEAYDINPSFPGLFESFKRCSKAANETEVYKTLLKSELKSNANRNEALGLTLELALLKGEEGDTKGALDDLAQVLPKQPESQDITTTIVQLSTDLEHWEQGGQLLENHKRYNESLTLYKRVFELDPNQITLMERFETSAEKSQSWSRLVDFYSEYLAQIRLGNVSIASEADVLEKRARIYREKTGEADKAISDLDEAIKAEHSNPSALYAIQIETYKKLEDWGSLKTSLDRWIGTSSFNQEHELVIDGLLQQSNLPEDVRVRLHRINIEHKTGDMKSLAFLDKHFSQTNDWKSLISILEHQIKKQEPSPNIKLVERAAKISEEKLHDEKKSIAHYKKLVELKPDHKRALDGLSRIYETTEKWAEFIEVTRKLTKAIKDKNAKAILFFKCGSVMEAKFSKENEAIRYYDAAIKTSPVCLPAVHGLRDLYLRRKDWARVIQSLELEVKLWQDNKEKAGVFAQIGRIYVEELKDRSRGMHYYESALTVDPECVPANIALFNQYTESKQWARAKPLALLLSKKMLRGGDIKTKSQFFAQKGKLNFELGDSESAVESFVTALEIDATNETALESFVQCSTVFPNSYDYENTFLELEKIYKKDGNGGRFRARIRGAQGLGAKALGDLETAEGLLISALELEPSQYDIVQNLIELYSQMLQWPKAIAAIERLVKSTKVDEETKEKIHWELFEVYANGTHQHDEAIKVLRVIAEKNGNDPEIYFHMAQEYVLTGNWKDAKTSIEKSIEIATRPHSTAVPKKLSEYYSYLGQVLVLMGNDSVAKSHLRRAVDYHPGSAIPSLALAKISIRENDLKAAETRLLNAAHRIMELGQEDKAVPLQRCLARVLERQGNTSAAIEAYRGILSVKPDSLVDRVLLSLLYKESNAGKSNRSLIQGIEHSIKSGPLLDALESNYNEQSEFRRLERLHSIKNLMGFEMEHAQSEPALAPIYIENQALDDLIKDKLKDKRKESSLAGLFRMSFKEIAGLFPQPALGIDLVPLGETHWSQVQQEVDSIAKLLGFLPEIYVGKDVPKRLATISFPRKIVVLDEKLMNESLGFIRYCLAYGFELVRQDIGFLHNLESEEQDELNKLLLSLTKPSRERSRHTNDFIKGLAEDVQLHIEKLGKTKVEPLGKDGLDGLLDESRRVALLLSGNTEQAVRAMGVLSGVVSFLDSQDLTGLGLSICKSELLHFTLTETFNKASEKVFKDVVR